MESKEKIKVEPVSFEEFVPPTYEAWKEAATLALKGAPFDKKLRTKTYEGITLEPIYTMPEAPQPAYPGTGTYVRGVEAGGYMGKSWRIAQAVEVACPKEANEQVLHELSKGSQCVNITLYPDACGHGVMIHTLSDWQQTLAGVDLEQIPLYIAAGASALPLLGLMKAAGDLERCRGCVGADPLGTWAQTGKLPALLTKLYDEMAEAIVWTGDHLPKLRTILVGSEVYHNGGAQAAQEIAYAMATAIDYINAMLDRGLDIGAIAKSFSFSFALGANFFMEIAKLRAARTVWAQIVAAYGGDLEAQKIHLFATTSAFTQTEYDPYVNILRAATQAFSGVIGGVDAMNILPFDRALGESGELSRRIARNQQIMLQEEFDLLQPADPAGGSWYLESLTTELGQAAWAEMQKIAAAGGMAAALEQGLIQKEVGRVLEQRLQNVRTRADRAVGTNMYANPAETSVKRPRVAGKAPAMTKQEERVLQGMAKIMAATNGELMVTLAEAFEAGATMAEVRQSLTGNFKESLCIVPVKAHRWTEEFEGLRQRTEEWQAKSGKNIKVFLANMGPIPQHKPRADFSAGFMEVAGFEVLKNDGFATVEEAAAAALASGAEACVICSTDDTYPELVPPLAKAVKAANPEMLVILAGAPAPEYKDAYVAAGVDDFIHVKADCYAVLSRIQQERGLC